MRGRVALSTAFAPRPGKASYIGRFAPSPTGALHAGSLAAALASWLDARSHGGRWLIRIEDIDTPRCLARAPQAILRQLAECNLWPDEPPVWQSKRTEHYQQALDRLAADGRAYPCGCSRRDIEAALTAKGKPHQRNAELVYPGTCRESLHGKDARAWRFRTLPGTVSWHDGRLGAQQQDVEREVGDFVLRRADGLWAYQLAVVVDDALQGITHVVRGEDLADNTARQVQLQQALGYATPAYLHTPLVLATNGEKLSKQTGAQAVETREPLRALNAAAAVLGLERIKAATAADALAAWVAQWRLLQSAA